MNNEYLASRAGDEEQTNKLTRHGSSLVRLFHRQPELVVASSVIGGALLALLAQKTSQAIGESVTWRKKLHPSHEVPLSSPGATEEQMEPRTKHPSSSLDVTATGTTEAIYELDPASLSPG